MDQSIGLFLLGGMGIILTVILYWAFTSGSAPSAPPEVRDEPAPPVIDAPAAPAPPPVAPSFDTSAPQVTDKPNIAAAVGAPDNLRQIKGVGPKLNGVLGEMGISRFDQIAAWTEADIAEVDQYLGSFKGRITRDKWIEQAGYLATGDTAGYEAKFGKL